MNSIRQKFTVLILICIFLCTLIEGGMAFWYVSYFQRSSSDQILSMTCRQEAESLNREFSAIHDSVNMYADTALRRLPAPESLKDRAFLASYVKEMQELMADIVRNSVDIGAYYLRLAPGMTADDKIAGFFYSKREQKGGLVEEAPTEIQKYDASDVEHVGWFYQPKEAGKAIWMKPYYNKNVDVYMISYIVPLYKNCQFIGVAGMDVDFNAVISTVSSVTPYESSVTALLSDKGEVYYHPKARPGTLITDLSPELAAAVENMQYTTSGNRKKTYAFKLDGKEKEMSFSPLKNGMVLAVSAELEEINAPQRMLFRGIVLTTIALALLAILITYIMSHRITKPLKQLTEAADEIAAGNMDVDLPEPGDDEVGILARSFAITVDSLKGLIAGMQNKAYRDSLTSVKNKAAYELEKERLAREMQLGEARYAILMLDVNDLKKMNDNYGHACGDKYLLNCSQLICSVFQHSPVYRIGGDEFLVLLEYGDYEHADELLAEFERRMTESKNEKEPWKRVAIASGFSVCLPSDKHPDEVFSRADEAMYEYKRKMKVGR